MAYTVDLDNAAKRELRKLPREIQVPMREALFALRDDPRPHGYLKLKGREEYRIRVGDYRIAYLVIDRDQHVNVTKVGHRRDFYAELD